MLPRRRTHHQLDLFRSPPRRATWMELPQDVRQETKRLLARLLAQYLRRQQQDNARREVRHER